MVRRWRQISKMRIVTHEERRTSCPALYFRRDDNLRPLSVSSRQN